MNRTINVQSVSTEGTSFPSVRRISWRFWFSHVEMYIILLVAAAFRLYAMNHTQFDGDQAAIFMMARNAVLHQHLVATSNIASIGIYNPPAVIYLLMIPAAFSASPLSGVLFTTALVLLAIWITYMYSYRYFGRFVAVTATSLFAISASPIFYSRFMWNQNFLFFFVALFIWCLLCGAVERRRGWFAPALFLLGVCVQLHGSGLLLIAPLVVTLFVSPHTVRIRDILFGTFLLLLLYVPYIIWLVLTHFHDATVYEMSTTGKSAVIDGTAWALYQQFFGPFGPIFPGVHSVMYPFLFILARVQDVMAALVIGSAVVMLAVLMYLPPTVNMGGRKSFLQWIGNRWQRFLAFHSRCGFLVLLAWQVLPLLYLTRHSITLYPHYFIVFSPGPELLLAIGLALLWRGLWRNRVIGWISRLCISLLVILLITVQLLASAGMLLDLTNATMNIDYTHYDDLAVLKSTLTSIDQLAKQNHDQHIYIASDDTRRQAFLYLTQFMQTPVTVFNPSCLVLPGPQQGPGLLLTMPTDTATRTFVSQVARVTATQSLQRPGGDAFQLQSIQSATTSTRALATFSGRLGFEGVTALTTADRTVLDWNALNTLPAQTQLTYQYQYRFRLAAQQTVCAVSALHQGDRLAVPVRGTFPTIHASQIQVAADRITPYVIHQSIINRYTLLFDTYQSIISPWTVLHGTFASPAPAMTKPAITGKV